MGYSLDTRHSYAMIYYQRCRIDL